MGNIISYIVEKGKAVVEKGKEFALPAAAGTYFLLSPLLGTAKAEEPTKPKPEPTPVVAKAEPSKPKITLDAWIEDFSVVDTDGPDSHTQRIEVINSGNDRFFRADHTTMDGGFEKWRVGMRPKYNLGDLISGKLGVFGSLDNADNYAIGAELTAQIAKAIRIGLELEKVHSGGADSRLFRGHASVMPFKDTTFQLGSYRKDEVHHLQLVGYSSIDDAQLFVGAGLDLAEGLTGKLNACFARYAKKKGKDLGFRIIGHTDLKGETYGIDLMLKIGDNKTKKSHWYLMEIFDGINDVTTPEKITRFRPAPDYTRASRFLAKLNALHLANGTDRYTAEAYFRTDDLLGKHLNLVAGGKWTGTKVPGQDMQNVVETLVGVQAGPFCLEYYCDFGKGMKPVHMFYIGTSARDVYDALAGSKKK